jgi:hypothetical protein
VNNSRTTRTGKTIDVWWGIVFNRNIAVGQSVEPVVFDGVNNLKCLKKPPVE